MRIFISVLGILSLVSCDTGDGTKTETGTVTTDSGDAPDTGNPNSQVDRDGDGFTDDCDDNNPAVFPGAAEYCDGLDNDCNTIVDDDPVDDVLYFEDSDADGFGNASESVWSCDPPTGYVTNDLDCDDTDARFNPGAIEIDCEDASDYNCDGSVGYTDADSDGFAACADCDDANPDVNDDAAEVCNEIDDDCDGDTDAEDPDLQDGTVYYGDSDGDGHGGQQYEALDCEAPAGFVENSEDCDDLEPLTYPSAAEICDEEDNDCDGDIDEGVGLTWYADVDGDGYGDATATVFACDAPQGYTANGNDCDDANAATNPGAYEICDGIDNNCDGNTDDASALNTSTFYADTDSDGYGDAANSVTACEAPSNHVENDSDCDDTQAATNPAADELCDGADNDCDGSVDEASAVDASTWYADADNDTYGNASSSQVACTAPSGHVADSSDCDDTSATTNPGSTEVCNGTDDNCDGATDEGVLSTFYADLDSDGYGSTISQDACSAPAGYVSDSSDCDDTSATTNPGATETCNGVDDNCDSAIDEGVLTTWYADLDSDGYGSAISQEACSAPVAYVSNNLDCNDTDTGINPGATEICDAADTDEDCDTFADDNDPEGAGGTTLYYPDLDADGYGDLTDAGTGYCDDAGALVTDNTDCDDSASGASINPGATETWYDGVDSDCDGASDYDADSDGIDSTDHSGTDCNDNDASLGGDCVYAFSTHDFTTCGTSGRTGPALSTCQSSYSTIWDDDTAYLNMTTNGIQRWTVPATATYQVVATGAEGQTNSNAYAGGTPATIQGDVDLTQGEIILILVGQVGTSNSQHGNENGGGGGTFVVRETGTEPLIVAGGGGGAPSHSYSSGCTRTNGDGQLGTAGKTVSCNGTGAGGTNGGGGATTGSAQGAAGAGLTGDGANGGGHCATAIGGKSFTNGGVGGTGNTCYGTAFGGFGGGGGGNLGGPGGAGGYSGGGAAGTWASYADYGGGGGSYNAGTNQSSAVSGSGNGSVTITLLELN